jgi:HD superfamily phosphodiesterase
MNLLEAALELATEDCKNRYFVIQLNSDSHLKRRDCSHDLYHIKRVVNLAVALAKNENIEDIELVQLGATLHDVNDQKYR